MLGDILKSQNDRDGGENMKKSYTKKEIEDAKKITFLFSSASEESKNMALGYLSALLDKEAADKAREKELQEA